MGSKKSGGVSSRVGINFHEAIEDIKDLRLKNGKSRDRVATEKITNIIVKHKLWGEIKKDILILDQKEVEQFGS